MRKFTLLLAAMAVSVSGMAQIKKFESKIAPIVKERASFAKSLAKYEVTSSQLNSVVSKANQNSIDMSKFQKSAPAKASTLDPSAAYNNCDVFVDFTGSAWSANMQPATLSVNGNTIELNIYGQYDFLAPIVGKIETGENSLSAYGLDSVTFANAQVVAKSTKDDTTLGIYSCDVTGNSTDGWALNPNANATFGAYWSAENQELFIPEVLGLYISGTTTAASSVSYIEADIVPVSSYADYMYKASVSGTSKFDMNTYGNEDAVAIPFGDGSVLVKGASLSEEDAWISIEADENSGQLTMPQYQFAGGPYKFTNNNNPNGAPGIIITRGVNAAFTAFETPVFTSETDLNYNIVYSTESFVAEYVLMDGDGGILDAYNSYTITVSSEKATGIDGVKDNVGKTGVVEYFDLSGRKVSGAAKGLVIEKTSYANGMVESRKVVK